MSSRRIKEVCIRRLQISTLRITFFRILHSKCITIIISICHFDHRIFKLTTVINRTCILKGKGVIFVKIHPKSANDRDTSDCNDSVSMDACIWKNRANLPVFAEFLLSFSPLSKHDTSYSTNTSLNFSQPFWLVKQWLKTDNMTFFDFKMYLGTRKILPVTSVLSTETNDRKSSN